LSIQISLFGAAARGGARRNAGGDWTNFAAKGKRRVCEECIAARAMPADRRMLALGATTTRSANHDPAFGFPRQFVDQPEMLFGFYGQEGRSVTALRVDIPHFFDWRK
jgi:hypothetical protein